MLRVSDEQSNVRHKTTRADRGRKAKEEKRERVRSDPNFKKNTGSKGFALQSVARARTLIQTRANVAQKTARLPAVVRVGDYPPPDLVAVIGAGGAGKTTLVKTLVRLLTQQSLTTTVGPITAVASKGKRITFFDTPDSLTAVLDIAKLVNLVVLVVDAKAGLQMETFEALNVLQATGFPKVFTVFTHMDAFAKASALKKAKTRLRDRIWREIAAGSKVFFLSGGAGRLYGRRDASLVLRALTAQAYKQSLSWRQAHAGILVDRVEDVTDPGLLTGREAADKHVPHTLALFGYVRGTYLDRTQSFYIPGYGPCTVSGVRAVADPCPCRESLQAAGKRSLSSRDKLLYAPMSNVGEIFYDADGVYVRSHGRPDAAATASDGDPPRDEGTEMLRSLKQLRASADSAGAPRDAPGLKLFDDAAEVIVDGLPFGDEASGPPGGEGRASGPASAESAPEGDESTASGVSVGNADGHSAADGSTDGSADEEGPEHNPWLAPEGSSDHAQELSFADTEDRLSSDAHPLPEPDEREDGPSAEHEGAPDTGTPLDPAEKFYSRIHLVSDPSAKQRLEHAVYEYYRSPDALRASGASGAPGALGVPKTRPAVGGSAPAQAPSAKARLMQLFDDEDDTYEAAGAAAPQSAIDTLSLFPGSLYDEGLLCGTPFPLCAGMRDVSNIVPADTAPAGDAACLALPEPDYRFVRNAFTTGNWNLSEVVNDVLHGKEFRNTSTYADEQGPGAAGGGAKAEVVDDVLEIGYDAGGAQPSGQGGQGSQGGAPAAEHIDRRTDTLAMGKASVGALTPYTPLSAGAAAEAVSESSEKYLLNRKLLSKNAKVNRLLEDLAIDNTHEYALYKKAIEAADRSSLLDERLADGSRFPPGAYLRVTLSHVRHDFACAYAQRQQGRERPLILGAQLPGEQNMGFVTCKVKKHRWHPRILKTRNPVWVSVGWKRFQTVPVYSMEQQGGGDLGQIDTDLSAEQTRQRMLKYTPEHMHCYCTFFGPVTPAGTGLLGLDTFDNNVKTFRVALTGTVVDVNPAPRVYKKLKLIGYPQRIQRNTCWLGGMFTSQLEAEAFAGAGVRTVSGIRGIVKKAEADGLVRCTFEDTLRPSDVVFLRTYVPVKVDRFYNEFADHCYAYDADTRAHAGALGLRTFAELRYDRGVPIPVNPDSVYALRGARDVPAVDYGDAEHQAQLMRRVPEGLLARLPFAAQSEVVDAKRRTGEIRDDYLRELHANAASGRATRFAEVEAMARTVQADKQRRWAAAAQKQAAAQEKQRQAEEAERKERQGLVRRRKAAIIHGIERQGLRKRKL